MKLLKSPHVPKGGTPLHTTQIMQNHSLLFLCCSYPTGHFINSLLQHIPVQGTKAGSGERGKAWEKALYRWSLVPCCRNAKASFSNIHPVLQIVSRNLSLPSERPQHAGTAGGKSFWATGFNISKKCDLSEAELSTRSVPRSQLSKQRSPADFPATLQEMLPKGLLL